MAVSSPQPVVAFESAFSIGDIVHADGATALTYVVVALKFDGYGYQVEVSAMIGGRREAFLIEPWRLTVAETVEGASYERLGDLHEG
ncbi:MAG: hypothetical protein GC190_19395 [Alphaproteobacteria bacterium]|nr:hypothetical protein [Alphaproteobacteria bacterium]